jgi:hypothetical protein
MRENGEVLYVMKVCTPNQQDAPTAAGDRKRSALCGMRSHLLPAVLSGLVAACVDLGRRHVRRGTLGLPLCAVGRAERIESAAVSGRHSARETVRQLARHVAEIGPSPSRKPKRRAFAFAFALQLSVLRVELVRGCSVICTRSLARAQLLAALAAPSRRGHAAAARNRNRGSGSDARTDVLSCAGRTACECYVLESADLFDAFEDNEVRQRWQQL